ncbi:MAG: TIGR02206 family membrane protein [Chloroflexota bacterium]
MGEFFVRDYHGQPFELFGTAHLVALGIVLLINLLVVYHRKSFNPRAQLATRYGLAAILLINETAWHLWNYFTGQWTIQTMLPLHLCSLLVFTSAYMLITKSYAVYEFAYFLGIAGATQALLTPDAGIYGFPHFRFFQVIVSHGAIVTAAIYMTFVEEYRPYARSMLRVLGWTNLYMIAVFILNQVLGSNYLFIAHKPETASLIDVLGPWPWYILSLEAIGAVLCLVLYLPYFIKDRRAEASQPAVSETA